MKNNLLTFLFCFAILNGFCQYDFDNTEDSDYDEDFEVTNESDDSDNVKSSNDLKGYAFELLGSASFNIHPEGVLPFLGVGVNLRYNYYTPADYISLSIGSPLNVGLQVYSIDESQTEIWYFNDIPLEFCFNVGSRATKNADYLFGAFLGAGISYNYSYKKTSSINILKAHSAGPHVSFGLRYLYMGRPLGLRASLMSGVLNNFKKDPSVIYEGETTPKILNLSVLYGFN